MTNFEARYVDLGPQGTTGAPIIAIGCGLNRRFRRFRVDNVRDSQAAGHRFYVRDASQTPHDIQVEGEGSLTALAPAEPERPRRDALRELPFWGLNQRLEVIVADGP